MARATVVVFVVVLATAPVLTVSTASVVAASPPKVDCSRVIFDMVDCMDYVAAGSNVTKPSDLCCHGFVAVVNYSPSCLCDGLEEAAKIGTPLDVKRAASLPDACNVKLPSVAVCEIAGEPPSPSPSPSPGGPTAQVPSPPNVPSPPPSTTPSPSIPPPLPPASPSEPPSILYPPAPSPSGEKSRGWPSNSSIFILSISFGVLSSLLLK